MIRGYSARLDWSDADEAYVATSPEFPGLTGIDADPKRALSDLREALEMAIEVLEEDGEELPVRRAQEDFSGQFRLRIPKTLHQHLAERAQAEGVSLNMYASSALAQAVGMEQAQSRAAVDLRTAHARLIADLAGSLREAPGSAAASSHPSDLVSLSTRTATTPLTS